MDALSRVNGPGLLPTGGSTSQLLAKKSATDADVEWISAPAAANGIPVGGTTDQLLAKNSNTDFDMKWLNAPNAANGLPTGGTAGQVLKKTDSTNYNTYWGTDNEGSGGSDNLTSTQLTLGPFKIRYNSISERLEFTYGI